MTKFQLTVSGGRPSLPVDYPTLGFIATANGAILDGSLSTPAITIPPDAYWSVYGGGSAETAITRYANPMTPPVPESPNGFMLAYSNDQNTYLPTSPASLIQTAAWTSAIDAQYARRAYFDAEAYKTGGNTDLQAIQAACAAATTLGRGAVVRLSPRTWDVGNGLSMSGYTCGLVGTGTSHNTGGGAAPEGAVIRATSQSGPVLNLTGWVYPDSFRGRVEFGKFALRGSGVADATKANTGMSNSGAALGSVHLHDISITETGGPCLDFYHLYLSDVERVTCNTPVSAKTNNVPYAILRASNGNRFVGLGFRSILTAADVGVGGALVVMDDGGSLPSDGNVFIAPWFENLHMPTNGALIECRANDQLFDAPYFTDCAKEAAATGTSFAHFGVPAAGPDQGGNMWRGRVPGAQAGINDAGITLSQSRNRIEGVKGYNGVNVILDSGVGNSYVSLGGARSGATAAAFTDNSGQTTNTLLDFVNYPSTGRSFAQEPQVSVAYKTADTTRNNTSTATDDPHLTLPVVSGGVYLLEAFILYNATTTADLKIGIIVPGSSTLSWTPDGPTGGATGPTSVQLTLPNVTSGNSSVGGVAAATVARPVGRVIAGGNGSVTIQWAQLAAEVSDAIVMSGSWLKLTRVA